MLLKASSQLSNMKVVKQKGISLDLKTPMNSLKDSLSLEGKTSQSFNERFFAISRENKSVLE